LDNYQESVHLPFSLLTTMYEYVHGINVLDSVSVQFHATAVG